VHAAHLAGVGARRIFSIVGFTTHLGHGLPAGAHHIRQPLADLAERAVG